MGLSLKIDVKRFSVLELQSSVPFKNCMMQLTYRGRTGPIDVCMHAEGVSKFLMNIFETKYCR
jgi:hypothetical protein